MLPDAAERSRCCLYITNCTGKQILQVIAVYPFFVMQGGSTQWLTKVVDIDPAGGVLEVSMSVSNVGDGLLQSSIVVDGIFLNPTVCTRPLKGLPTRALVHCYLDMGEGYLRYAYDGDKGVHDEDIPDHSMKSCVKVKFTPSNRRMRELLRSEAEALKASGDWDADDYKLLRHNCEYGNKFVLM